MRAERVPSRQDPIRRLRQEEIDFLPAALRVARQPVHPWPRALGLLLVAMVAVSLTWAWTGEVDMVAQAPGRLLAHDGSKTIQPMERGLVRRILVRDGERVHAGQDLLVLDATAALADEAVQRAQGQQAELERFRAQWLLAALARDPAGDTVLQPGVGRPVDTETEAEWRQITARRHRLQAEHDRRLAELTSASDAVRKAVLLLPLRRQREEDLLALNRQGFVSDHAAQDRSRERIELEQDLLLLRAREAEARAALAESGRNADAFLAETRHALTERAAQAGLRQAMASEERAKAAQRTRQMTLQAPVAGLVQQLAIHTVGGVVTEAQPLMVIVPESDDPAGPLAEVQLRSQDIGFVRPGQVARIKLETFPYTRYGSVDARVDFVGADAVTTDAGVAAFPVRLRLGTPTIDIDGQRMRLSPGMVLTAEIHIGRRTVADYMLSPLQRRLSEALRER